MRADEAAELVSKMAGHPVGVATWYHWEKAENPFDLDLLPLIAKVLGVAPRDLIPE